MFATSFSSVASFSLKDPNLLIQKTPSSSSSSTAQDENLSLKIFDPATAIPFTTIRTTTLQETKDAIIRSKEALCAWKDGTTAMKRSQILHKWNDMVKENADDLGKAHHNMIIGNQWKNSTIILLTDCLHVS